MPESLTARYARMYEQTKNKQIQDQIIREMRKKVQDKRVSTENKRMMRYIINYHARKSQGIGGHRPSIHTMKWSPTAGYNRRRHTL